MLKYGANNIGKVFLGANGIGKAYLGSQLVYDGGGVTPPTPPGPTVNYRISGSPTIANGIMSLTGQSARNFIYTNESFAPGSADWTIQTSVRYNSFISYRDVFASVNADGSRLYSIALQGVVSSGSLSNRLYLSSNGTSWNKMNGTRRVSTGVTGEWRDIKVECASNVYRVYIRARGGEWSYNSQSTVTGITYNSPIAFGGGFANAEIDGDIDLAETKIYIGGSLWWEAITTE